MPSHTTRLIPLRELERSRFGRELSSTTRYRWCRVGLSNGVRLSAVLIAGCWCATEADFDRFLASRGNGAPGVFQTGERA